LYIREITLTRIRGFQEITVDLGDPSECRLHTILIGKNGTCKTSFLRALAIGLADSKDASGLLAEDNGSLIAEDQEDCSIEIKLSDGTELTTTLGLDDGQDVLLDKSEEAENLDELLVVAYGINRLIGGDSEYRAYRLIDSTYNLFVDDSPLIGTELALRRLRDFVNEANYESIMNKIKDALGLDSTVAINLNKGGGVTFSGPGIGQAIPLASLSDGYKETLGWMLDFYSWGMRAKAIDEEGVVKGILLIDEIEQHLYPGLQTELLSKLRELFPKVQIVATTHSPMIALGAHNESELVVFKMEKNGHVVTKSSGKPLSGYSIEDILVDPNIFESQPYGPETSKRLSEYQKLVRKKVSERNDSENEQIRNLSSELMKQQLPEVKQSDEMQMLQRMLKKHELDK